LTGPFDFLPPSSRVLGDATHTVKVSCTHLNKELYLRNSLFISYTIKDTRYWSLC